jgi:hypothetical protein
VLGTAAQLPAICVRVCLLQAEHFDSGVCYWLVQLTTLFGEVRLLQLTLRAANLGSLWKGTR